MNDLFTGGEHEFIHIFDKSLNIFPADFTIVLPGKNTPMLQAFDMLAGDSHIDDFDIHIRLGTCFFYSLYNTGYCFLDVGHYPPADTGRLGFPHTQHFNFVIAASPANGYTDFGRTNIEPYYDR